MRALSAEVTICHRLDQVHDLFYKRPVLMNAYKLVKCTTQNQASREVYGRLINPDYKSSTVAFERLDVLIKEPITDLLC